MTCVVIFNASHGWHSDQLEAALTPYGVTTVRSNLAQCRIDLDLPAGLFIPELDAQLPDAVIVRGIAAGSFEQITVRLDVLHTLTELGIPVFNTAAAIERTVDKVRTSLLLGRCGIPTLRTWACEDLAQAHFLSERAWKEGKELVLKPLFGCQGQGIIRLSCAADLNACEVSGNLYYLQEFIPPLQAGIWQDWRVFVVNHHCIAAMVRCGRTWVTNVAQGAECFQSPLGGELGALACQASRAVGAAYAGVDLIQVPEKGWHILEVNSIPSWRALQQTTDTPIADALVNALLRRVQPFSVGQCSW